MTPDASLPPADVQRPEPLTEEELARIERGGLLLLVDNKYRLIADLRASRAEVERLRGFLDDRDRKQYEAEIYADWKSQQ